MDEASAASTRVLSTYGMVVEKPGATTLFLSPTKHPLPVLAVGQEVDVSGTVPSLAGLVVALKTDMAITRNAGDEVRVFTTTVTLG